MVHAVGDGAVVVEGGEDLLDGGQDRVDAADVEECFLLPGERGIWQVFCGGAGPHGEGHLARSRRLTGQPRVGGTDVGFQIGREAAAGHDGARILLADRGELARRLGVQTGPARR